MSWRSIQLNNQVCDQDQLILNLFQNKTVNYVGPDHQFKTLLMHNTASENLVLILNSPVWVSDVISICKQHLTHRVETFYIGINRYCLKGNDTCRTFKNTGNRGGDLLHFVSDIASSQGFLVTKSGQFDNDLGRYFNFVQPLTWVYGHKSTN